MQSLNFLPADEKKQRLLAVMLTTLQEIFAVLLTTGLIAALMLFLIRSMLSRVAAAEQSGVHASEERVADQIRNLKQEVTALQDLKSRELWVAPALADVLVRLPADIALTSLSLNHETKDAVIQGTAKTRDALLAFESSLRSSPYFTSVSVPLSSIARAANITFSITASLVPDTLRAGASPHL